MFAFAARNLTRHRGRTGMALASVVFGVASLILSGGFVRDVFTQLGEAIIRSQSGHVQIARRGFLDKGARSPEQFVIDAPQPVRSWLAGLTQVEDVMGRVAFSGLINNGKSDLAIIGEGVEPDREAALGSYLKISSGRRLTDGDRHGILIGQGVAEAMRLKPADQVTLLASTAEGALNTLDFDVVGVFQSFSKDYDARAVRIPLAAAQELIDSAGINVFVLSLKQTADSPGMTALLRERFEPDGFEVFPWYELSDFYSKTVDLYERQFGVLRLIILFLVLLSVANSINMTVAERTAEFGTMMALGNRRVQISRLIVIESLLVGVVGGVLGVLVGLLLATLISAIGIPMPPPPNSDLGYTARIEIVPYEVVLAFAVGVVASVAASFLPARRTARMKVVDALRENA